MYEDPFGDFCERIMIILSSFAMILALSVYYMYTFVKFRLIFAKLAIGRVYNGTYFFLLKKWNSIYWGHLYAWLYCFGLRPELTDEDTERMKADLRTIIEDKRYCGDPGVAAAIANARAVLQQFEKPTSEK